MPRNILGQPSRPSNLLRVRKRAGEIFLMTSKDGVDEHKIYRLGRDNSLTLISTNAFGIVGGNFGFGATAKALGSSHYLSINDTLLRSRDGCVTWEATRQFDEFNGSAFTIDAGGRIWFIGEPATGGGGNQHIFYSDDDGDSWTDVLTITGRAIFSLDAHPTDSNIIIGSGYEFSDGSIGVEYTTDRGQTWQSFTLPGGPAFSGFEIKSCLFTANDRFMIVEQDVNEDPIPLSVFYSNDPTSGPESFTEVVLQASAESGTDWFNPVLALSASGERIYAFGAEGHEGGNEDDSAHIWESLDNGVSWTEIPRWPVQEWWEDVPSGFYDPDGDRLIVITSGAASPQGGATDDSKIWVSSPPGQNWREITPEANLSFSAFMVIWSVPGAAKTRRIVNRLPPF